MSNNEETEINEEELLKRKPNKIIEVRHTMEKAKKGELEKTKAKLEEREAQLGLIALRSFEQEREKLLELVPEDKREELAEFVDTPEKLETIRKIYSPEEETSTKPPTGKATLSPIRTPSETPSFDVDQKYADPWVQKISDLYDIIGDNTGKVSASDKLKAQRTLDNLYFEVRKGLKDRRDKGLGDYVYPKNARFGWNCQSCGKTNQSNSRAESGVPCKFCGYRFGIDPVPTHPYS